MSASDIPSPLEFVDPDETDLTFRVCLWSAPGTGKSVAAASAPAPLLVISADRPSAYAHARKRHGHTTETLREIRYKGPDTLAQAYLYLAENPDILTVVLDPVSNVYDRLVDSAPTVMIKGQRAPDYQWVNKKLMGFITSLRTFDVNVIIVAHEKLNDGDKGDGKMYPALGGPSLINKLLAEMDIVAHIERVPRPTEDDPAAAVWIGQIQPRDNLVTKDGTDALGDRRIADLSRWFEVAKDALKPDTSDIPFADDYVAPEDDENPDECSQCGYPPDLHVDGECPDPAGQMDLEPKAAA